MNTEENKFLSSDEIKDAMTNIRQSVEKQKQLDEEKYQKLYLEKKRRSFGINFNDIDFLIYIISVVLLISIFFLAAYNYRIFRYIYIIFILLMMFIPKHTDKFVITFNRLIQNNYIVVRETLQKILNRK